VEKKEKEMIEEDGVNKGKRGNYGGAVAPQSAGVPGPVWIVQWALLTTAAIPAALIAMAPIAAASLGFFDLGVTAGFWSSADLSSLVFFGFVIAFALILGAVQWLMLRQWLPRAGLWFGVTGAGLLIVGLAAGIGLLSISAEGTEPILFLAVWLLAAGLALGVGQWLYLRRYLPNAIWIVPLDILAAGSLLLGGRSFTSLIELAVVLVLPGAISGIGLWLLLRQIRPELPPQVGVIALGAERPRHLGLVRLGLGLAALIPLFFLCSWIFTASQLALAKSEGIYRTPEEAVIALNSQGWGGAEVVRIEDVRAAPNSHKGDQPHVWFGGATVYLDRVPEGWDRTQFSAGSYFIHVREGWVHVSEGAFPELIGWVMELYGMEGIGQRAGEK
jgi:hypothetical protein